MSLSKEYDPNLVMDEFTRSDEQLTLMPGVTDIFDIITTWIDMDRLPETAVHYSVSTQIYSITAY